MIEKKLERMARVTNTYNGAFTLASVKMCGRIEWIAKLVPGFHKRAAVGRGKTPAAALDELAAALARKLK